MNPVDNVPDHCADVALQNPSSAYKATVYRTRCNGQCTVIKSYDNLHPFFRATLGRFQLRREINALKRTQNLEGFPRYIDSQEPYRFTMSWIEGSQPTKALFHERHYLVSQLAERVKAMHHVGVTHNDIRLKNLLIDGEGQLHIIDFASAITRSSRCAWQSKILYKFFCFSDRVKVVRIKREFSPELIDRDELRLVKYTRIFKSISRFWKQHVYTRLKKVAGIFRH